MEQEQTIWALNLVQARQLAQLSQIPVLQACLHLPEQAGGWILLCELSGMGHRLAAAHHLPLTELAGPASARAMRALELRFQALLKAAQPAQREEPSGLVDLRARDPEGRPGARNLPCPCGSGIKAKRCGLHREGEMVAELRVGVSMEAGVSLDQQGKPIAPPEDEQSRGPLFRVTAESPAGSPLGVQLEVEADNRPDLMVKRAHAQLALLLAERLPMLADARLAEESGPASPVDGAEDAA